MTKYRGEYQGKTRGKYVSRAFISNQDSANENFDFGRYVNTFMDRRGIRTGFGWEHDPSGHFSGDSHSYHIGGATVDVCRMDYKKNESFGNHFVRIKMVSNDSLDDIVKMTLAKFPSLKEINFKEIA